MTRSAGASQESGEPGGLFFGYFAVKLLGWRGSARHRVLWCGCARSEGAAVVMIRVPTLTDQHRQDHARVLIMACRLHPWFGPLRERSGGSARALMPCSTRRSIASPAGPDVCCRHVLDGVIGYVVSKE